MKINQKYVGVLLVSLALLLLIILISVKIIFDSQAVFMCEAVSLDPNINMEECPAHNTTHSWLVTVGFIISGILLLTGTYFFIPQQKNKNNFKEVKKSDLDNDEKIIYDLLISNSGSMYQSDLVKNTDFSKVKITRILDGLEQKDITERKRRGMTNIVVLK